MSMSIYAVISNTKTMFNTDSNYLKPLYHITIIIDMAILTLTYLLGRNPSINISAG